MDYVLGLTPEMLHVVYPVLKYWEDTLGDIEEWPVHISVLRRTVELFLTEPRILKRVKTIAQLMSILNTPQSETKRICLHNETLPCRGQKHSRFICRHTRPSRMAIILNGVPNTVVNFADEERVRFALDGLKELYKQLK